MSTVLKKKTVHEQLAEFVGSYYADLGGYIRAAYPWKEANGLLEHFDGPEEWVFRLADQISNHVAKNSFNGHDPVEPIYVSVASGNGAGKSAFAGMLNNWILSSRPMSRITVTANTGSQLRTKTWPEVDKWTRMSITAPWFEIQTERIYRKGFPNQWNTVAHTWNIANTQSSAGQHSREGSSVYIVDESSHVPEVILEQFDGGLTDGEPFMILLGNCTNRGSRLFKACFGSLKKTYINLSVDTRICRYTNKKQIDKWIEERGIDSDWVKAHVKGEAPNADDMQFIDSHRVEEARLRATPHQDDKEPLLLGIDFARGGKDSNYLVWRRGRDARQFAARKIPGDQTRDTTLMVTLISNEVDEKKPDAIFGDAGGLGGPIMDRLRQLFGRRVPVIDVYFGGAAPTIRQQDGKDIQRHANMRAYIWDQTRLWLPGAAIEDSQELQEQLIGPMSFDNASGRLQIESKEDMAERGLDSPDWADALATTFAQKVAVKEDKEARRKSRETPRRPPIRTGRGWMRA